MARRWSNRWGAGVAALIVSVSGPVCAQTGNPGSPTSERESRPLGGVGSNGASGREVLASIRGAGDGPGDASGKRSILDNPLVRTGGSLTLVLGLIYGLAQLAKRMTARGGRRGGSLAAAFGGWGGGPSPAGLIEVLGRYPIGRGQALVLLKVDTRILLLGQSVPGFRIRGGGAAGGLTLLCEVTEPEQVASVLLKVQDAEQASASSRFGEFLRGFDARHGEVEGTGVVEVESLRKTRTSRGGDRAELWEVGELGKDAGGRAGSLRERLGAIRSGRGAIGGAG